ncbi:hypothetical protein BP5796_09764 [Coleophoma crateriformis]|uniref:Vacuolar membrane PQ loop repeat protein n=1 Tax=Coleophoma crateriformis TaxID=565419 RepID=A0A3D8QZ35_9HELO|nr:hypothetical protein BP5796_09764 [Coleophoma crateriformis]
MASTLALLPFFLSQDLTTKEALSGIFGSISLATWVCLLIPQLIENYQNDSADGISLVFLFVWLLGDLTNLAGALWAGLVPTVIALAIYFCIADFVLISQCLYYNNKNARKSRRQQSVVSTSSEQEPLLSRRRSSDNTGLPGSHRRTSALSTRSVDGSLVKIEEEQTSTARTWFNNTISILGVIALGVIGWGIAYQTKVWTPTPEHGDMPQTTEVAFGAEVLGYFSAICYLGARIPQILKNHKDRSVEGLAPLFFMLSMMGNTTYGAQILFHSQDREYLLTNLPWLIGSIGTIFEDCIIFVQFHVYNSSKDSDSAVE